ncbi:hypothetical protein [Synechococcus elongatus]|uniref:Uncharacterized protein n=1 Tax=Synechococcus elongatus PCC 11801 TaxID=2219813 RepID=A0AAN1UU75_SYNEL|nr:hypothetical protein [Synechococcus elongatus]AZB72297.1 hypothetical protein DOP62_05785 [Synechococcus elongatus PCC 11801]
MRYIFWSLLAIAAILPFSAAQAGSARIDQSPNLQMSGVSGGNRASDCGYISDRPNEQVTISPQYVEQSGYLRISVSAAGNPTLLIEGPSGRLCSMGQGGRSPQHVGVWPAGVYNIYVGDRQGQSHPYQLMLSGR